MRFSLVPASEVPQVPATPAEVPTSPAVAVTAATEAITSTEPATVPSPAVPVELAPASPSVPAMPAPASTEKKLTMLDAAAKVLETATAPMTVKEILAAMEESGLWKPGKGLTPANSLVAAIGIETRRKPNPRFRKTAPGKFEYTQ